MYTLKFANVREIELNICLKLSDKEADGFILTPKLFEECVLYRLNIPNFEIYT